VSGAWNWGWNGANLIGVAKHPVVLNTANHVVYSPHDYGPSLYQQGWFNSSTTYASLAGVWDLFWGFIDNQKLAPVWVGEFGTPNANSDVVDTTPGSEGQWFSSLVAYIGSHPNMSWTYWALNGNDWFALLNSNWSGVANPLKQSVLSTIQSHQCH
jgi:endoglucanase